MNIYAFPANGAARSALEADPTKLQFKVEMYQRAIREWAAHISGNEFIVLMQIMDRTVGWGLREATFTTSRLREGDSTYRGISEVSRRTLFRALATLEEKGFIVRRRDAKNQEIRHYAVNVGWNPDMITAPKRLQSQCQPDTGQCHSDTAPVPNRHSIYRYPSTDISYTDTQPGLPAEQSGQSEIENPAEKVREQAGQVRARHRAHVNARAAALKGSDRSVGVEAAWRAAMLDAFPAVGHVPWDVRQRRNIKGAVKAWLNASQISFEDFAAWAVTNWPAIMSKQFKWMTDKRPPTTPVVSFFLYFLPQFAECWAEGTLDAWMSDSDRTEVERLMGRGMTHEQAMVEIGARQATKALRKETEERNRDASAKLARAKATAEQSRKLAELGGTAPVHPQSPAARARRGEVPQTIRPTMEIGDHDLNGVPLLDLEAFDAGASL